MMVLKIQVRDLWPPCLSIADGEVGGGRDDAAECGATARRHGSPHPGSSLAALVAALDDVDDLVEHPGMAVPLSGRQPSIEFEE